MEMSSSRASAIAEDYWEGVTLLYFSPYFATKVRTMGTRDLAVGWRRAVRAGANAHSCDETAWMGHRFGGWAEGPWSLLVERFERWGGVEFFGVLRCAQDDSKNLEQGQERTAGPPLSEG